MTICSIDSPTTYALVDIIRSEASTPIAIGNVSLCNLADYLCQLCPYVVKLE